MIFLLALCLFAIAPSQAGNFYTNQYLFTPALITPYPNRGGINELVRALPKECTCGKYPVILQRHIVAPFFIPPVLYKVIIVNIVPPGDLEGLLNQLLEILVASKAMSSSTATFILHKLGYGGNTPLGRVNLPNYQPFTIYIRGHPFARNKLYAVIQQLNRGQADAKKVIIALLEFILDSGILDSNILPQLTSGYGVQIQISNYPPPALQKITSTSVTITNFDSPQLPKLITNVLQVLIQKTVITSQTAADILFTFGLDSNQIQGVQPNPLFIPGNVNVGGSQQAASKFIQTLIRLVRQQFPVPDGQIPLSILAKALLEFAVDSNALSSAQATSLAAQSGAQITSQTISIPEDDSMFNLPDAEPESPFFQVQPAGGTCQGAPVPLPKSIIPDVPAPLPIPDLAPPPQSAPQPQSGPQIQINNNVTNIIAIPQNKVPEIVTHIINNQVIDTSTLSNILSTFNIQPPVALPNFNRATRLTLPQIQSLNVRSESSSSQNLINTLQSLYQSNTQGQQAASTIWQSLLRVAVSTNYKPTWNVGPLPPLPAVSSSTSTTSSYSVTVTKAVREDYSVFISNLLDTVTNANVLGADAASGLLSTFGINGGAKYQSQGAAALTADALSSLQIGGDASASSKFLSSLTSLVSSKTTSSVQTKNFYQVQVVKLLLELGLDNNLLTVQSAGNLAVSNGIAVQIKDNATTTETQQPPAPQEIEYEDPDLQHPDTDEGVGYAVEE